MLGINNLRLVNTSGRAAAGLFCRQPGVNGWSADGPGRKGLLAVVMVAFAALLQPIALQSAPRTARGNRKISEAFEKYVRTTDERNNSELQRGTDLVWIDSLPAAARKKAYADLKHGEVELQQRTTSGARLEDVLRVLEDYDHHAEYYAPDVARSRIDARDDDHFRVFLRFHRQKVITVVLNTEHEIAYYRDTAFRAHSRSSATHVAEVENPGKSNEREKPREEDNGFLWGMETWWRMEEKDNGVYVQSEVVSLSRDIPAGLGWMIGPFVTAVPK